MVFMYSTVHNILQSRQSVMQVSLAKDRQKLKNEKLPQRTYVRTLLYGISRESTRTVRLHSRTSTVQSLRTDCNNYYYSNSVASSVPIRTPLSCD